ncbi:MAG: hypothetical protein MUF21_02480 [Gemmatimonadaceae bacterium]|nr:hypothetical protein [Gemmatimonadaceae bacterium]
MAASLATLTLLTGTAGCYEFGPLPARPTGEQPRVEVLLNDRGRADLVNRIGPGALSLEGTLVARTDSLVRVRVLEVTYFDRSITQWSGEEVAISESQMRDIRAKRLSRLRTTLLAGITAGVALVFIVTRTLAGGGDSAAPGPGGPPNQQ